LLYGLSILQRENKRASRRIQNTDSSCRATADDTSFHTDDNADGDTSDMRGSHDAMLDSYVSTLLSNMGNEMLRSEDEIARVQEIRDPEYKYNSETCNQVCVCVCFCVYMWGNSWHGDTMGTALDLRSTGHWFISCSGQSGVTALGKLLTPMCLCHQAV